MDPHNVYLVLHLVGFALGLGGATISDITFFRAVSKKQITPGEFAALELLSKVIWIGLFLLILSGAGLMFEIYKGNNNTLPLIYSSRWQMKITLVGVVFLNGLVFWKAIFPHLKAWTGQTLSTALVGKRVWLLAISGTISILSWYSILVLSTLPRTFRPPYFNLVAVYLVLLLGGILFSRLVLGKKLK